MQRITAFVAAGAMLVVLASRACADHFVVDLDPLGIYYGHLNQTDVGPNSNMAGHLNENNFCAPTATMNSFEFLQNKYPTIFGTDGSGQPALQGGQGSWLDAAKLLAGPNYMNTDRNSGTLESNWVDGKVSYLNHYAPPGSITIEGQDKFYWQNNPNPINPQVQNTAPTAAFLLDMLQRGEDIEIGISPTTPGAGIGHVLTLSSIDWNDANNNLKFDNGDALSIDGIDPGGGVAFNYALTQAGDSGYMTLTYGGVQYQLDAALAESPVTPLPRVAFSGMVLLGGLAVVKRSRRAAVAA
jgi:hypothetical protein